MEMMIDMLGLVNGSLVTEVKEELSDNISPKGSDNKIMTRSPRESSDKVLPATLIIYPPEVRV